MAADDGRWPLSSQLVGMVFLGILPMGYIIVWVERLLYHDRE